MEKFFFKKGLLVWRWTPWDDEVFGLKSTEVLEVDVVQELLHDLIRNFISHCQNELKVTFISFKSSSNNIFLKRVLFETNFYVGSSANTLFLNLKNFESDKLPYPVQKVSLEHADYKHSKELEDLSYHSFKHSKFHEDPFICNQKANLRIKQWVKVLIEENETLIHKVKNEIVCFLSYKKTEDHVHLILGGTKNGFGVYAVRFWVNCLNFLKTDRVSSISTDVSSANMDIMNLYFFLGFAIQKNYLVYHWQPKQLNKKQIEINLS